MKQVDALTILKSGRNVYLTGAAGSGKTYVLNEYISYLKERGVSIGITASTGIAATHIAGMTIHSWSGLGIKDRVSKIDLEHMEQKQYLWKRYEKTKVLIIDEVSMLSPTFFDSLDNACRHMKRNDAPFGGMQVVLSGDFFQLPPVVRGSENVSFITESRAWKEMDVRICYLDEQYRHEDQTLENILNEMRGGRVTDESRQTLLEYMETTVTDLPPTRLYTHNEDVDALNDDELGQLSEEEYQYEMKTKGKRAVVESLVRGLLAPQVLRLKKGAQVMFVKNNFEEGYVNGTLGHVEDIEESIPIVRTRSGKRIYVFPAEWSIEEDGRTLGSVTQLPLRLAWAITVHKSQGMSLDAAEIDLSRAFVAGQGYVALSRLRTLSGLFLTGISDKAFAVNPKVRELDVRLRKESQMWEKVITRFSKKEMQKMHNDFILACGGVIHKKEIDRIRKAAKEEKKIKRSTFDQTKDLIEKKYSLNKIAKERGLTVGTILSHFEKLHEQGVDLSYYKPKAKDMKVLKDAFTESADMKLTPAYRALKGKYTFEELRLARLFV